jgi:hypothetical protein
MICRRLISLLDYPPPLGDCGSIRGICKACHWETDIGLCECGARNVYYLDKRTGKFTCRNCGATPHVACEKCSGPLFRPKTKAR